MRFKLLNVFAVVCIAFICSSAKAQIVQPVKASIPFDFYVGNELFPAGEYQITEKEAGAGLLEIKSDDGKAAAFFFANEEKGVGSMDKSELVFKRLGEQNFLNRIEQEGDNLFYRLAPSRMEKRLMSDDEREVSVNFGPGK